MGIIPDQLRIGMKLERIFVQWSSQRRHAFYDEPREGENPSRKFVHYTSAEAALKILQSKRIWMRSTTCMSDYREVVHGHEHLLNFFNEDRRKSLFDALEPCHSGIGPEVIGNFDSWWNSIRFNSYITSISEHVSKEDDHGRLSMWRAFGGGNVARVAVVIKMPWVSNVGVDLNLTVGPVEYFTRAEVESQLLKMIENIRSETDFLKSLPRETVGGSLFQMLIQHVLCLKHEGFQEEREWRIIHSPQMRPSVWIKSQTEVINGVPQRVYGIPLDVQVSPLLVDLDLSQLFDRLIIGPTPFPTAISDAFVSTLKDAGVKDAHERVVCSLIPIRP